MEVLGGSLQVQDCMCAAYSCGNPNAAKMTPVSEVFGLNTDSQDTYCPVLCLICIRRS